eukprot:Lithocolla_globosa_v1_NODE_1001_length_2963_cov_36.286107.p1 type:complete len:390 gc:universal NODE_1001_length_2963_cov_36.286107:1758-2927(+)
MDKGYIGLGIFIDLKIAFDTVNHKILLRKLEKYGVCGSALAWITDYLTNRYQYIKGGGGIDDSEMKQVICGVPQGSILGPLLFIIYINDFLDILKYLDPTIFADDTTLMSFEKDLELLTERVHEDLKAASDWFQVNKLTLNIKKTHYIVFSHETRHSINHLIRIHINGHTIKRVDNIKHLGVIFHQHIGWHKHINHILKKVSKFLIIFSYIRKFVDIDKLMLMYNAFIYPHFLYCNLIWGNRVQNKGSLETLLVFQKKLARIILFAPFQIGEKVHAAPLMHKLKMLDIFELCKLQQICLAHTIINNKAPTINIQLTYISYSHLSRHQKNKTLHITQTKTTIGNRGIQYAIQHAWNNLPEEQRYLNTVSYKIFKKTIRSTIFENIQKYIK